MKRFLARLILILAFTSRLPAATYADFTLLTSPASTDYLVGYRPPGAAGAERRVTLAVLNTYFSSNITGITNSQISGLAWGKLTGTPTTLLGYGITDGGTVTSASVTTANGVSGSVATSTTTPAISLTLGAITPTSVNGVTFSGSGSLANSGTSALTGFTGTGTHSGTSSGTNTGDQTITLTGDGTGSGTGSFAFTLANTAVTPGSYTNANITVNAKGLVTAASNGSGGGGSGTVTSVSVTTANGVSGSVATATTTPAISLTLGAITPSSVNGVTFSGSGTLANSGTSALTGFTGSGTSSGTNTGDQTSVTGNAGSATVLQTARTINGTSFNGSANITVTAAADTLTGTTLPALNGASLTSLNATNLASGTVAVARSIDAQTDGTSLRPDDVLVVSRAGAGRKVTSGSISSIGTNTSVVADNNECLFRATASLTLTLDGVGTNTRVYVTSIGDNVITFAAGSGMTISGVTGISGNGSFATLVQISSSVWEVYATSASNTLNTSLFAFYPLDESASATTRRDIVGGETITATAASGSAAGKTRLRALLMGAIANQAFASTSSAGDFKFDRGAAALTIGAWVKPTALTNAATIASQYYATGNKRVFILEVSTAGKARFTISTDGTSGTNTTATSTATLSTGTWYYVIGYYNPTTGKIGVVVNAGTPDETTTASGMFVTTGNGMQIGAQDSSATVSTALQDVAFWSRNLSTAEISRLYNSGTGLTYPFTQ